MAALACAERAREERPSSSSSSAALSEDGSGATRFASQCARGRRRRLKQRRASVLADGREWYGDSADAVVPRTPMLDMLQQGISAERLIRLQSVLANWCGSVRVLLENLGDARNGAAVLRTAEGFGLQHVHVLESVHPFRHENGGAATGPSESQQPSSSSSSLLLSRSITVACDQWLRIHRSYSLRDTMRQLRGAQQRCTVVGTVLDPAAESIFDVDFEAMERVCVVLGNEERGLSAAMRQQCDRLVYVPMVGFSQSFNVSVTAACVLYHLYAVGRIRPDLSREEARQLYTMWVVRTNRNAKHLIAKHGFDYPEL